MKSSFESTWSRIMTSEGQQFHTVTGLPFTYKIVGNAVRPSRAKQNISRSDFKKVAPLIDAIEGPSAIRDIVRGSAYVFAILADPRVRDY